MKKPFPWYYCFGLAISQRHVNRITWPRGRSCSQEYLLHLTPPKLSAIPTVFRGALRAPPLRLVWKGFLESLYIYFLPLSHYGCDNDFATGIFRLTCTTRLVCSCHTTPSGLVKFHLFSTGQSVAALVLLLSPFKFALLWHWCCSTVFSDSLVLVHHLPRSMLFWLQYCLLPHSVLLFLLVRWCGAFNLIFWPLFPLQKVHTSEKKSVIQEEGWAYYTFSSYPLFGLNRDDKFR